MTRRKIDVTQIELLGQPIELQPGMVCAGNRNGMSGTADHLPMVYRAGALDAEELPSRMGNKLVYRDGRVEEVK